MASKIILRTLIVILGLGFGLNGCGGSSGEDTAATPPPPPAPPPPPPPPPPPAGAVIVTEQVFASLAFTQPLLMLQAPGDDSRWYVLQRGGQVLSFDNVPGVTGTDLFIDVSMLQDFDAGFSESGLLGMAFHPDYQNNREVFLSFTRSGLVSYVSRFTSSDNGATLDLGSEEPILMVVQNATNHNGGTVAFGPDGFLYVGFGDGGGSNDPADNAQNTQNLLGAIVRVDVDSANPYAIPPGNPFAANAGSLCLQGSGSVDCPEIFAWGLRNPWRFSFDRNGGQLWAGDVGQGAWEEVDRVDLGGNYGWRIREGAHCNENIDPNCNAVGLIEPVTEYPHPDGFSITGGFVYRGSSITSLVGSFVYGDFSTGRIWGVFDDGQGGETGVELLATSIAISSFGEANDGELYLVDYDAGTLHQLIEQ